MEKWKTRILIISGAALLVVCMAAVLGQGARVNAEGNPGTTDATDAYTDTGTLTQPPTQLPPDTEEYTQAWQLLSLSPQQLIEAVGPLFQADMEQTQILASISLAQFLLESSYGTSELSQNANNLFGMKRELSGNTWDGSTWDSSSTYEKTTLEYVNGEYVAVTAVFRRYPCISDSIADHSAYLLGAKNGNALRYAGLAGEKDYRVAAQILKDGGYATNPGYAECLCKLIEQYQLTQYDV